MQTEAVLEMQAAFEWYEEQKKGLGYEFIEEIESCYKKLCEHPFYYTAINNCFRRIKVNRFPYIVVYEIEGSDVIINSFFHTKRQPKH
ncbi:type II toxin-antitoxin system RelE/ParE family toxin [Deminuibacter soli]|uniref:Type II toxin-antitoxin system RelE/ParE family toxin n=1 Tax=Deminuibacter soli TaxID=2291815 RepID=A0A3E1NMA1_9BACT|nr:type II toxin-antitoxin system RelE/ParE family toxin [Deminuibacter soli]